MVKKSVHRDSIINFYERGMQQKVIASRLKVARSVVSETIQRYKDLRTYSDRPGRGPKTTMTTKKVVKRVRESLRYNGARSQRKLASKMGISRRSMGRIMKEKLKMKS